MNSAFEEKSARERILDAAGDIFGRRGYKAATVREICDKAEVNVAAVNYYFQGKEGLYREVARELIAGAFNRHPVIVESEASAPPEVRLKTFIRGIFSRLLSPDGLLGFEGKGQLISRELADPSPILDDVVADFIRPTAEQLSKIVRDLIGPEAPEREMLKCQVSIVGQCFHYALARPILTRLLAEDFSGEAFLEELSTHVTQFSLAGIADARKRISD